MANFVTRHFNELVRNQKQMSPGEEDVLTADVSTMMKRPRPEAPVQAAEVPKQTKKKVASPQELHEERVGVSRRYVESVNSSAKKLAINVDTFIRELRESANEVADNPQLLKKMEHLRRMSVSFIRCVEHQLPGYATALFVEQRNIKGD